MKTSPLPHSGNAGFSLLEMTSALFVLGVGLYGTVQMYQFATGKIHTMRESQIAAWTVEECVETVRAMPFDAIAPGMQLNDLSGRSELDRLPAAELSLDVKPHADRELELKEVTAMLRWRGRNGRLMEKSLTTLVGPKDGRR